MTKRILFIVVCFTPVYLFAQKDSISINPKYLEDQIYLGITYNIFVNTPPGFLHDGLAYGFQSGYIRDLPFNKQRNIGMGIGVGYNYNSYVQNVVVKDNNATTETNTYRFTTNNIAMPIQFRWRTSTLEKYKFWRIYTGLNLTYILGSSSNRSNIEGTEATDTSYLRKFQTSYTLSAGYGSWNLYLDYGLNPFFNDSLKFEDGTPVKLNSFKLGLVFYIL